MTTFSPPEATTLDGHLERITYHNPENHYTVAKVKADGQPRAITAVGYLPGVSPGQALRLHGRWETHPRFGQQFKIQAFEITLPASVTGIRRYLESGVVKGIGPKIARQLVAHFQTRTLEVIEKAPDRLCEVKGIGPKTARRIAATWQAHHAARTLMQFLQENGLKLSYAGRLLQAYGPDALEILRENPFRVARELPGIGFLIADTISQNLGQPPDAPERVRACLVYLLEQQTTAGHLFLPEEDLLERCGALFGIPPQNGAEALAALAAQKAVVVEKPAEAGERGRVVYLHHLHAAETGLARRLKARLSLPPPPLRLDPELVTSEVLKKLAIKLSDEQTRVLTGILAQRIAILTGGPGTGKTTLIRSLTAVMEALGKRILLAAPTGRAARRLGEVTGRPTATIHKLLGYNFREQAFERDQDDPLETDALIVDEASMVDLMLMHQLLKAVPMNAVLILVGDVFQLPSVGPGSVLADLIRSGRLPVHELTTIFRQAEKSPIVVNAHRVRNGRMPEIEPVESPTPPAEFCFLAESRPARAVDTIVTLCRDILPARYGLDPIQDIQVLTPMHRGEVGTLHLNQVLQRALNPSPDQGGAAFRLRAGDKVMHLRNDYQREVFNGDIGTILSVEREKSRLTADFYGRSVRYDWNDLEDLSLAYAISVHKSQGSEYPAVVVPVMTQHYALLQRNLIYTALTRGKNLVVFIGTPKALAIAVKNDIPRKRLSRLAARVAA